MNLSMRQNLNEKIAEYLAEKIIRNGYGHLYIKYPFHLKTMERYKQAEKEARESKRGLWADD